ncbi:CoA-binding protein, partial [Thermococci archaeon]
MSLSTFFEARSVAVIGASKTPGKIGHEILKNLALYEYKGKVYPVNPKEKEILGMKCYKTVSEIENEVELAVIAIPPKSVPGVVEECGRKGVRGIVIVSGGFKELGDEGREIEEQIVSIARKYGMRIIGPNCIGIYDSRSKIDTFFQSRERMMRPKEGAVSFITQSGTFGCSFLEWAAEEGIGVARFVSYGNRADVDEPELIEFLGEDERTRVIAVYMEGVGDGRRLMQSISKTSRRKPVLILKAGRTKAGSRVALSHTGWLAGEDRIFDSAIKQAGGIRAENMEELQDMIKALVKQPLPKGNRIGMVTNGAGPCVMAADSIVERGMKMA